MPVDKVGAMNPYYEYGFSGVYGYGATRTIKPQYDKEQKNAFINRFRQWIDYNIEFLKQAFNIPNSDYETQFESSGIRAFHTSDDDDVQNYRDEMEAKISNLESLIKCAPLIPLDDSVVKRDELQPRSGTNVPDKEVDKESNTTVL